MPRPDIRIGERVFRPRQMGAWETVRTHLGYGLARSAIEWRAIQSSIPPSKVVIDWTRLAAYYGQEASQAFADAVTPRVHSVLELQIMKQARWAGRPNPFPEPDRDPITGRYAYRFVKLP